MEEASGIHTFYMNSHKILREANFTLLSIPNADRAAVERTTRQLEAVQTILLNLEDPYITEDERCTLIETVASFLTPLQYFLDNPPPPPSSYIPRFFTGLPGRPRYVLDLARAQCLHALGASWVRVAEAMGVARRTLYYHLEREGINPSPPPNTDISDDALDEIVAQLTLEHPFEGAGLMRGHLLARGIRLPIKRVQDSLKRVDLIGVLTRYPPVFFLL